MVDVMSILNGIKGKVLDATTYEHLKRVCEIQNENITQLEKKAELAKQEAERIRTEDDRLQTEIQ